MRGELSSNSVRIKSQSVSYESKTKLEPKKGPLNKAVFSLSVFVRFILVYLHQNQQIMRTSSHPARKFAIINSTMGKSRIIGVDLDDVLLDFNDTLFAYHNRKYGTKCERKNNTDFYLEKI